LTTKIHPELFSFAIVIYGIDERFKAGIDRNNFAAQFRVAQPSKRRSV